MVALQKMIRERLYGNNVYWGTWVVANICYLCLAFVCWEESVAALVTITTMCGVLQMMVIVGVMGGIAESEKDMVDVLRYFPIARGEIRKEFYYHVFVTVVIQGVLSFLPTLITISEFSLKNMCGSAITYIASMLVVGILAVEGYTSKLEK